MDSVFLISNKLRFSAGHLAWAAMFLSILIWGAGELRPGQLGNTGNWYRIILVLFAAASSMLVLLKNSHRISRAFPAPLLLLLLYGLVAIISSLYVPAHSFYSMWKAFEVIVDVLVTAAILSYARPQDNARVAYRTILIFFGALLVIYWIEALITPSRVFLPSRGAIPFQMQGLLPVCNPNGLAFLSAVVSFAAICGLLRAGRMAGKALNLLVLAIALPTLILAQSRTSVIGLGAAVLIYLIVDRRFGLFCVTAMGLGAVLLFTSFEDTAEQYLVRGQSTELFTTLSGRTRGWEAAWASFQQSPILGHGFVAAARAEILGIEGASTLHGAVFDVLVGVGLLGLLPWAIAIIWGGIRLLLLSYERHPWLRTPIGTSIQAEMLGVLALILVRSSTSSGLAVHDHTFMVFLAVLAYACSMKTAIRQRPAAASHEPLTGSPSPDILLHT